MKLCGEYLAYKDSFTYIELGTYFKTLCYVYTELMYVVLWKIKHETLKPWNFQLTKLVTEHRFAQRSLKCETLKNGDFVAEITPSRSMIEFHLHSFALSNWNGAWKRLFADTKLFEHGVGSIHKTLCIFIF